MKTQQNFFLVGISSNDKFFLADELGNKITKENVGDAAFSIFHNEESALKDAAELNMISPIEFSELPEYLKPLAQTLLSK